MSAKLPTLWTTRLMIGLGMKPDAFVQTSVRPEDAGEGVIPGAIAYVPRAELEEATEALRLERAEVERLRAALKITAAFDHGEDCIGRYDEHGDVNDEDVQDEHCDCGVGAARAALSPRPGAKES